MGWDYRTGTRKDLLAELLTTTDTFKVLAYSDKGSHLWRLIEFPKYGKQIKIIAVDLLESRFDQYYGQMYGNKSMDESMGPFVYDCPIDWLTLVAPWGRMSEAWRAGVREYHKHCDIGCGNFQAANAAGRAAHDAATKQAEATRLVYIDREGHA